MVALRDQSHLVKAGTALERNPVTISEEKHRYEVKRKGKSEMKRKRRDLLAGEEVEAAEENEREAKRSKRVIPRRK